MHIFALVFVASLAAADRPVEPITYPTHVDFQQHLELIGDRVSTKPLIMTTVQFDRVDHVLPDLRVNDADQGVDRAVEKIVLTAVDRIPRQSVTMKAIITEPIAIDEVTGVRRLAGPMTVKIFSREGLAPARNEAEGSRVTHIALDRVGFELRWSPDFPLAKAQMHRGVVSVDARHVGVVVGRHRGELNVKLAAPARDALVDALKQLIGDQDPARFDPRIYVHLLDLNKNNFGAYPLDAGVNDELIRAANDQPSKFLRCMLFLERRF